MIESYHAHRADLEQLRQMFLVDQEARRDRSLGEPRHQRIDPDFTRPEGWLASERWDEYRQLFRACGLAGGIQCFGDDGEVYFVATTEGLGISGSGKGYLYSVRPPEPVVADLDAYRPAEARAWTAFRHIEGNWYLYLDVR